MSNKEDLRIKSISGISDALRVLSRSVSDRADDINPAARNSMLEVKAHLNSALGLLKRVQHKTGES